MSNCPNCGNHGIRNEEYMSGVFGMECPLEEDGDE